MKRFLFIILTLCTMLFSYAMNSFAWDYPLDIDPVEIQFNHDKPNHALNIRKKYGIGNDITVPEYSIYYSRNEKFAYLMGDTPSVLVKFWTTSPDPSLSLTIDAITETGSTTWNLQQKVVLFNGSGFSIGDSLNPSNYVTMNTVSGQSVPSYVDTCSQKWDWRVVAVGGTPLESPYHLGYTSHNYYTIFATPQLPMTEPWTDVLDRACVWASGATTRGGVVSGITTGAYNSNFKNYDATRTHFYPPYFYLTDLFTDSWADCQDMSVVVVVFSNALGVSDTYIKYEKIIGNFHTKNIDPIGSPSWQAYTDPGWAFHQVGYYEWSSSTAVYDACIRVDEVTPRIPLGESDEEDGDYYNDLFYSGTWSPQGAGSFSNGEIR